MTLHLSPPAPKSPLDFGIVRKADRFTWTVLRPDAPPAGECRKASPAEAALIQAILWLDDARDRAAIGQARDALARMVRAGWPAEPGRVQ